MLSKFSKVKLSNIFTKPRKFFVCIFFPYLFDLGFFLLLVLGFFHLHCTSHSFFRSKGFPEIRSCCGINNKFFGQKSLLSSLVKIAT